MGIEVRIVMLHRLSRSSGCAGGIMGNTRKHTPMFLRLGLVSGVRRESSAIGSTPSATPDGSILPSVPLQHPDHIERSCGRRTRKMTKALGGEYR